MVPGVAAILPCVWAQKRSVYRRNCSRCSVSFPSTLSMHLDSLSPTAACAIGGLRCRTETYQKAPHAATHPCARPTQNRCVHVRDNDPQDVLWDDGKTRMQNSRYIQEYRDFRAWIADFPSEKQSRFWANVQRDRTPEPPHTCRAIWKSEPPNRVAQTECLHPATRPWCNAAEVQKRPRSGVAPFATTPTRNGA